MVDPVLVDYSDPENITLARDLFGTAEQEDVEAFLNRYCQANCGARVETVFRSEFSVGGVFGVTLSSGVREIIKVWPPHANRLRLKAQIEIQSRLHGKGFPAPRVHAPPEEFEGRTVMAMEVIDGDLFTANDPYMRKTLAALLHDFIQLANDEPPGDGMDGGWLGELEENLWPKPHNALFDFEATRNGAEWIDAIAAEARKILLSDSSPTLVTHTDWSCRNILAKDKLVTAVFDWDSVFLLPETQAVGDAAAGFMMTWYFDDQRVPTPADSGAFVIDYEKARGSSFTAEERKIIAARTTYGLAYGARCGHALWKGNPPDENTALARMEETGAFTPESMGLT